MLHQPPGTNSIAKKKKGRGEKKKSNAKTVGLTSRKNAEKSPWTRPAERLSAAGRSQSHPGVEAVQFGQVSGEREREREDS